MRQALDNAQTALQAASATLFDMARLTVLEVNHSQARLAQFSNKVKTRWGSLSRPGRQALP